jgi:hypothetical protein
VTTQMRHCRCCGAEIKHNGWLAVCDDPQCERLGTEAHARRRHLTIFPAGPGCYGVFVCDVEPGRAVRMQAVYFDTNTQAKDFVARVQAGLPKDELAALIEAHEFPRERITVEELRRRAKADE